MKIRKKNIVNLDVDSTLALMQEIYNDIVEQKNTASIITKKMLSFMKEPDDMSMIGPVIKEQQKILNDCTEKKLSLVKIQHSLLKQMGTTGNNMNNMQLSAEDKDLLQKLIDEKEGEGDNNVKNYSM